MKQINQFITEYIIKKKLDKAIDSEDHYKYIAKTKPELVYIIKQLIEQDIYDFNCIDTSEITDMSYLFDDFKNVNIKENFDVSRWNVSNVITMRNMFVNCKNFNCDLSEWDVSNVENISGIFSGCITFDYKSIENWNVSNVTNMENMFFNCVNFNCDLSKWNVSKVENIIGMFKNCKSFEGKGLENWDISNVKSMNYMFDDCTSLKNKPSWYKE